MSFFNGLNIARDQVGGFVCTSAAPTPPTPTVEVPTGWKQRRAVQVRRKPVWLAAVYTYLMLKLRDEDLN